MAYTAMFLKALFAGVVLLGHSQAEDLGKGKVEPTMARVGMYVVRIDNINVKAQTFDCEFYLWLKWKGTHSPENFEFVNGIGINKRFETFEKDTLGFQYYSAKVNGTFYNQLDVSRRCFNPSTVPN